MKTVKWFFIRPFDTLFFRDARPFSAGQDNLAQSVFPPAPSTTYGAVRTASLIQAGVDLVKFKADEVKNLPPAVGNKMQFGSLHLTGPILARREPSGVCLLFLSPLNLVYEEGSRERRLEFLIQDESSQNTVANGSQYTNLPLPLNLFVPEDRVTYADRYLTFDQALALLCGIVPDKLDNLISKESLWKADNRVGIAQNKARSAEEGMLYSSQHIQINNHPGNINRVGGLAIKVIEGKDSLPSNGIIQLGGEKRFCEFQEISVAQPTKFQIELIAEKILKNSRFFFWLISPAVFSNDEYPFIPGFIDHHTLKGKLDDQQVELVACQIGRSVGIGGWNIVDNVPKPMRRAVPPGSIYFFKLTNGGKSEEQIKQFVERWMLYPLPGQKSDYDKQGFGTILIGGY